ncbi:hypothetical protein BDN72DRAFT_902928 [Pluteus cervinus]|uniref:Uncharacterized protein n=1 Tax=Pluteus cervinus TaxID=181527 RepID=A0ACD3AB50_9AGAR|nr:hypothetical protein BDN72DRAFT_902928 [Pluteus cervinus]
MADFDDIPLRQISIQQHLARAQELLDAGDPQAFVTYILTGVDDDERVVLDPILNRATHANGFFVTRDYDSVLGFHKDIIIAEPLTAFPVAYRDDTLSANIHIIRTFTSSSGEFRAAVHKIPNICLGKWGTHNMIRVFFPELYNDAGRRQGPFLSQEEQRIFYEQGLRPAIAELLGDKATEWPTTYQGELWRARARSGAFRFQTKVIPEWCLPVLAESIRDHLELNGVSWHHGIEFLHQIRGVKHATTHAVDEESAVSALDRFMTQNGLGEHLEEMAASGDWWIDVGLEISSMAKDCVAWRTDSHYRIVRKALGINSANAERITRPGSSKYVRDVTSHLPAVAGCRIAPGVRAQGDAEIKYVQLYTTDKSLIYHPDGQGHFGKIMTGRDVLEKKDQAYIENLYGVYINAIDSNHSLARIELRTPIKEAHSILLDLDDDLIRRSLVVFPGKEWWGFRAYRALAIKNILAWQSDGSAQLRARESALTLTAAATWLINSLHSTPDLGPACRELLVSILPSVGHSDADPNTLAFGSLRQRGNDSEAEESDGDTVLDLRGNPTDDDLPNARRAKRRRTAFPGYPYGAIFIEGLCVGPDFPVPRITERALGLSDEAIKHFFGFTYEDLRHKFFAASAIVRSHPSRTSNKVRKTFRIETSNNPPASNLASKGYRLDTPQRDLGSDVSDEGPEQPEQPNQPGSPEWIIMYSNDVDLVIQTVWGQFLHDLTAKAPNPKPADEPSYCKLSDEERLHATDETYKNKVLSDYFTTCRWKVATDREWTEVFDHLWLGKGQVKRGKVQNYASMTYFSSWEQIKARTDGETVLKMRKVLKAQFNKLYWMPFAQAERIWVVKPGKSLTRSPGLDSTAPAPRVIIQGPEKPTWFCDGDDD